MFVGTAVCHATWLLIFPPLPAAALSEIQREHLPTIVPPADELSPADRVPLPGSTPDQTAPTDEPQQQIQPSLPDPEGSDPASPRSDPDQPLPQVLYDLSSLPEPTRRMRELIIEACKSGDIEKLRPLIGSGDSMTQLSLADIDGDPIEFLKTVSGDSEGQEILAILEEVLSTGYVHLDAGTPQELFVWPYFFAMPLDRLDGRQRVELFKLVTSSDYEDMKQFGAYIFYRTGITPDGRWVFFVAGD